MNDFYNSFTFIIVFMIAVLIMNMSFGKKFTEYFLLLVLLSMVMMNTDKFKNIVGKLGG